MKRRRKNVLTSSDEKSDVGSQTSDSDNAINSSKAAVKQKPTARKRGKVPVTTKKKVQTVQDDSDDALDNSTATVKQKPTARKRGRPPTKKKAQPLQDNSDDGGSTRPNTPQNATNGQSGEDNSSDSDCGGSTRPNTPHNANNDRSEEDNSSDSDSMVNSSIVKQKPTARKRGRPPTKKKAQPLQDDSDDEGSVQPSTSQNANSDQSDDEDNSSDSDYIADSTSGPKRRPGRPSSANKRLRLQNGSLRDTSPQPSTSQNGIIHDVPESESDSDSNSADSDFGPVNERSLVKKKPPAKQQLSRATGPKSAKKKIANSASNINSSANNSLLSASFKKGIRSSQTDASMDPKAVESLAQKLVYYLLIEDQKKYAIRRKGIITHVLKDDNTPKMYIAVINKANNILKKTYGMELMKLTNQTDSYLLINILGHELGVQDYIDLPRIKQQQHGLILFLLTVIYMNENVITEDELTKCLKPLGIDLTSKRMHPVFGDVKKYITTELVKQMYLKYECISKEPPKYEFTWGERATQEFDKRDLLQFACTIMDDTSPDDWRMQFRDAEASAKPKC